MKKSIFLLFILAILSFSCNQPNSSNQHSADIDCSNLKDILQKTYDSHQSYKQDKSSKTEAGDLENLNMVISIIENCGMPTLNDVSKNQLETIWLVIQNAPNKYMEKYVDIFIASAKQGDFQHTELAMIKDRMLRAEGKAQVYGTQVSMNKRTNKWEFYNLANPEYVNQRRKEIGLIPLEKYLTHFKLTFDVPQKEK
ncbi:MAG: DUF6624 domain-containing protein [Saprospiraceae bacterium]